MLTQRTSQLILLLDCVSVKIHICNLISTMAIGEQLQSEYVPFNLSTLRNVCVVKFKIIVFLFQIH